jgi:hypothetical protein
MRGGSAALAAAWVMGAFGSAHAALIWDFTASLGDSGSGVLSTDTLSGGSYQVTGISGTFAGQAITGLSTFDGADNLLYPAPQYLDRGGLGFALADGEAVEIWAEGAGIIFIESTSTNAFSGGGFSATLVPEPATAGILTAGAAVLGLARRRRRT